MNKMEKQKLEEISKDLYNLNFFICNNKNNITQIEVEELIDVLSRNIRQLRELSR